MRYPHLLLYSTAFVCLVCSSLFPQNPPAKGQDVTTTFQPQGGVLRTTTRLVVLDVVATDSKGQPVPDLKPQDFTVSENGEPQEIADFSFHQPGTITQPTAHLARGVFSNDPPYSGNSCMNVILLDAINTDFSSHAYAQDMLIKYLDSAPAIQPTAVYALENDLKMLHDFTTDTKVLRDVLAHYRPQGPTHLPDVYAAASPFERRGTFQPTAQGRLAAFYGMTFLAQALSGYPGRKNMIWISEGFPLNLFPDALMGDEVVMTEDYSPLVEKIADDLMAAQVALYPISAAGVSNVSQFSAQTAMSSMAQRTGGKTFFNRNDIDLGVRTSLDDGATYYTLDYYPKNRNWDTKFRHIEVKIARKDVKLHYRDGYYGNSPNMRFGDHLVSHEFSDALGLNAPSSTGVRFQAAVVPGSQQGINTITVNFAVDPHTIAFQLGGDNLSRAELNCVVWAYPPKGEPVRAEGGTINAAVKPEVYQEMMKSYFPCHRTLGLKPGRYTLKLGVLDRTSSKIGTTSTQITVP
jgi:VWFA-related protein